MRLSLSAKVASSYFLIANLWRFASDKAIFFTFEIDSIGDLLEIQTLRTLFFTSITALVIYLLFNFFLNKLAGSKKQFQQLFELNPNPMWVFDIQSLKFLAVNEAAICHYGYTKDEFLSMSILDIRPADDFEKLTQSLKNRSSNSFYSTGIWRHKKKNNEIIFVRISSHALRFQNHDAELILAIDVTKEVEYERNLLEMNTNLEQKILDRTKELQLAYEETEALNEELKAMNEELLSNNEALVVANETIHEQAELIELQSKQRLHDLVESINDAFITLDKNLTVVRANKNFEELVKIDRNIIIGKNFYEVFPTAKDHVISEFISLATLDNRTLTFETYADRLETYLRIKIFPTKEGLIMNASNINDEIKTRKEILLAKKNLDLLINNTKDVIWAIDRDYKLVSANRTFHQRMTQLLGFKLEIGDNCLDKRLGNSYIEEWMGFYNTALDGSPVNTVINYPNLNNEVIHLNIHLNPLFDENNRVIGVGCFAFDISDQKKMEFERNEIIQQLTQQNKNLEEFSYIISHNLRSPVASIKGLVDIIQQEAHDKPGMLEMLNRSAHRLDEVITDLNKVLEVKSISTEQFELIEFNEIVQNIETLLEAQLYKIQAKIHRNFEQLPHIRSSKPYINSILYNLISNAIKYRKEKEILIISITTYPNGTYNVLEVKDNGMGIDLQSFQHKLFKLYQRFHLHVEGKGLGLYMTKTQVEALGGVIDVKSKPDVGTTFTVSLPKTPSALT